MMGIHNSSRLGVYYLGSEDSPLIIFLHGWMGEANDWLDIADALSEDYCCVALELPGHGELGNMRAGTQSIDKAMDWLTGVLDSVAENRKVVLVGYSLGGRLAAEWAAHKMDRVAGLVLLSARPGMTEDEREARLKKDSESVQVIHRDWSFFIDNWYRQPMFHGSIRSEKVIQEAIERRRGNHPGNMAETLQNWSPALQRDRWPWLIEFPKPLLYIAGANDRKYAGLAVTLKSSRRGRQVEVVEDAGHSVHLDQTDKCVHIMKKFFEKNRERLWP